MSRSSTLKISSYIGLKALSAGSRTAATALAPATGGLSLIALIPALACSMLSNFCDKSSDKLANEYDYFQFLNVLKSNVERTPNHDVLKALRKGILVALEKIYIDYEKEHPQFDKHHLSAVRIKIEKLSKKIESDFLQSFGEKISEEDLKEFYDDRDQNILEGLSDFLELDNLKDHGAHFLPFFNERFPVYVSFAFTQEIKKSGKAWVALQKLYFTHIQEDLNFLKKNQIPVSQIENINKKLTELAEKVETIHSYSGGNIEMGVDFVKNIVANEFDELKAINQSLFTKVNSSIEELEQHLIHGFKKVEAQIDSSTEKIIYRIDALEQVLNIQEETSQLLTNIPAKVPAEFEGREEELSEIKSSFQSGQEILLLNGLGGIGKTTIASSYFHNALSDYNHLAWITVSDGIKNSILNSTLCSSLGIIQDENLESEKLYDNVLRILSTLKGQKLLVLDNVNEPRELYESIPDIKGWHILITTRCRIPEMKSLAVPKLEPEAARKLFNKFFPIAEEESDMLDELLESVDYHTLSIELLAKNLSKLRGRRYDLHDLLKNLNEKGLLNPEKSRKVGVNYKGRQQVQYEALISEMYELNEIGKEQQEILLNLSLLPSEHIAYQDIFNLLKIDDADEDAFQSNLDELRDYGWIDENFDKKKLSYKMHQVIQEVVRHKSDLASADFSNLFIGLTEGIYCTKRDNPYEKRSYTGYANYTCKLTKDIRTELKANLVLELSKRQTDFGNYPLSLELSHELEHYEHSDSNFLSLVQKQKAHTYRLKGEYSSAEKINHDLLNAQSQSSSALIKAELYNEQAKIYLVQGKYDEALEFQMKSKDLRESCLNADDPELADVNYNLAMIYLEKSHYNEALLYAEICKNLRKEIFDDKHPDLAEAYFCLALIHQSLKDYDKALNYGIQCLTIRADILSKNHPDLAATFSNLGKTYRQLGDFESALENGLKAIQIYENRVDIDSLQLASSLLHMANTYIKIKEFDRSIAYALKALELIDEKLDKNNPYRASAYFVLAASYFELKDKTNAIEYIEKVLVIYRMNFEAENPSIEHAEKWKEKILTQI